MKNIVLFLFIGLGVTGFAQNVPFRRLGSPFTQTNIELTWSAPIKNWPLKLWGYRAYPAKVSPAVVSNLMVLGSFTDKDKKKVPDNLSVIAYTDPTEKRSLLINTEWAFIDYNNSDADDMHVTNGVPDRQKAFKIAGEWLPKLGIERRQLFSNPNEAGTKFYGAAETVFLYSREGNGPAYATNTPMYSVSFFRALDGFKISGGCAHGGGQIEIGHDAKISKILVSWRNYKRDKHYQVATPKILMQWIREGKAVWYAPDADDFNWASAKKISITKATPYYYSDAYGANSQLQNWTLPFAELETMVETDQTNVVVYLDCPLMDKTKP